MRKTELVLDKSIMAFLCLVLCVDLWILSIFYIPVLVFILGLTGFTVLRSFYGKLCISTITISVALLLLFEVINYFFSDYKPNSILFLRELIVIFCFFIILDFFLKNKANRKYKVYLIGFISLLGGLLALFNIPIFFFKYYEASIYGFSDFTQFRFLYNPMGFLSNEWVTIILCFLPFPFMGLLLLWKKKYVRLVFIFIIGVLIFNILISFSRAGILALLLFVILLNIFFIFYEVIPIKKILIGNAIALFSLSLFIFCFFESFQSSFKQSQSHQRSVDGRLSQWEQVINTANVKPFFGIGSKNYALLGRNSQEFNVEYAFTGRTNNTFLQLILEKGWIGFSLWLSIIGFFCFHLVTGIKKRKNKLSIATNSIILIGVISILFRELFFSSLFYNSGLLLLFLVLLSFNHSRTYTIFKKPLIISTMAFVLLIGVYFYKQPENALSIAKKGLEHERELNIHFKQDMTRTQQDSLVKVLQLFQRANELSPSDAMFQHNLGWLYWSIEQKDSAYIYLSRAVRTEPNIALYHISKGLIEESIGNEAEAFAAFKRAILLSPDIVDSPFFNDLKERNPLAAEKLLRDISDDLLQRLAVRYSSIIDAKSGKLLLSIGETEQAYKKFVHVTQFHPNLSRPWFYLGLIEQKRKNYEAMKNYYKKCLFLSPFDHLPLFAFATYYKNINDISKYESYQKAAEKAWENKRSVHSSQSKRQYFLETNKDDVIPNGLLDYITPSFKLSFYD